MVNLSRKLDEQSENGKIVSLSFCFSVLALWPLCPLLSFLCFLACFLLFFDFFAFLDILLCFFFFLIFLSELVLLLLLLLLLESLLLGLSELWLSSPLSSPSASCACSPSGGPTSLFFVAPSIANISPPRFRCRAPPAFTATVLARL